MRIGIELQSLQLAESLFTDSSKAQIDLIKAIIRRNSKNKYFLLLNGLLPLNIIAIRKLFKSILPSENIVVWYSPLPIHHSNPINSWRAECALNIRDAFIKKQQLDGVLCINFFMGYENESISAIGPTAPPTVVYLQEITQFKSTDPSRDSFYQDKISNLSLARQVLASSAMLKSDGELNISHLSNLKSLCAGIGIEEEAKACVDALELAGQNKNIALSEITRNRKLKMAYISPLPPERSGIADFSAELLPELASYYSIDVVVSEMSILETIPTNCAVITIDDFQANFEQYDRVFYHIGNSPCHHEAAKMLKNKPGIVAFHDMYFGDLWYFQQEHGGIPNKWLIELYRSHGFSSLLELSRADDFLTVLHKYPCNFSIIKEALGAIVHSHNAVNLVEKWCGQDFAQKFDYVPLARESAQRIDRAVACSKLGFATNDIIVCSFGMVGPTKYNDRLLKAWQESTLKDKDHYKLVFVGVNDPEMYGKGLIDNINAAGLVNRVKITGWVNSEDYNYYLNCADLAIQLRANSRGEASAAALDCLNYGIPLIVNKIGSLGELPADIVNMVDAECQVDMLVEQLNNFYYKREQFIVTAEKTAEYVSTQHSVSTCAKLYFDTIEARYNKEMHSPTDVIRRLITNNTIPKDDESLINIAKSIGHTFPTNQPCKLLLVDVTAICQDDLKTGIQRVVRSLLIELMLDPPEGYRVEPVYLTDKGARWHYRFARQYALGLLGYPTNIMVDDELELSPGDIFLGLDLAGQNVTEGEKGGVFKAFREKGVPRYFVIYDLLPITLPKYFPEHTLSGHTDWLRNAINSDGVICISKAVADETLTWLEENNQSTELLNVGYFHLGADVANSIPTTGLPPKAEKTLALMNKRVTFLMVGTVEPRKGHAQILDVFSQLWKNKVDVNLVIVGKQGWMVEKTAKKILGHKELGKRLVWLEGVSDEYLECIYQASSCLIAASEGEGFGLPLIEAAQYSKPIIARDIPVFREVAGDHAFYLSGRDKDEIADEIKQWLLLFNVNKHPSSDNMPWLTWKESSEQLKNVLFNESWYLKSGKRV